MKRILFTACIFKSENLHLLSNSFFTRFDNSVFSFVVRFPKRQKIIFPCDETL